MEKGGCGALDSLADVLAVPLEDRDAFLTAKEHDLNRIRMSFDDFDFTSHDTFKIPEWEILRS